ncbi:MAG: hypothetical protein ACK5MV_05665 [Aminipila sp.]
MSNNSSQPTETGTKKKREFPHIFVILFIAILVATIATYIVPAGQYQRVLDEATNRMIIDPASFSFVD